MNSSCIEFLSNTDTDYGKFCYYEKNQSVRSFKAQYWEVTPMVRSHTNKDPYTKMLLITDMVHTSLRQKINMRPHFKIIIAYSTLEYSLYPLSFL